MITIISRLVRSHADATARPLLLLKNTTMKATCLFAAALLLLASCSNSARSAQKMLNDPEMRSEIYRAILNDSAHSAEFITEMMKHEGCRNMMVHQEQMVNMICTAERMDSMLNANSQMSQEMLEKTISRLERDTLLLTRAMRLVKMKEKVDRALKKVYCPACK
jgi:hypothetical protein